MVPNEHHAAAWTPATPRRRKTAPSLPHNGSEAAPAVRALAPDAPPEYAPVMSQSPYAAQNAGGFDADPGLPARTSILAVLAVIFAVICFLPGTGLLAILLGVAALVAISGSNGRLEGRGAALSGIILGVITTTLWAAIGFGALQGWTFYTKNLVTTGDQIFQAAAARDYDALREHLTDDAAESLTNEQIDWFIAEVESREGAVQGASTSIGTMWNSFGAVFGAGGGQQNQNVTVQQNNYNQKAVVPVAIQCADGSVIAWIVFEPDSFNNVPEDSPKAVDILVQFASQDVVTLRTDGPARDAAKDMTGADPISGPDDDASSSDDETDADDADEPATSEQG